MPFVTPDFQAIRDGYLRDIANQPLPDGTPRNVASDGDYAVRANGTGAAVEGLYQHQHWIARQILPDSADLDYLIRHASLKGLTQKAATAASGTISFSGVAGSPVPIGTEAKTSSGIAYVTTVADTIGVGGTVTIAAQASATGEAGNQDAGTALTLTAAPANVQSAASIVTMTGGTDIEIPASLLSRLLFVLRNPPCGGALHDYYTWAMNVPGVARVYPYSQRRTPGSVDVVILTAGGMPDGTLLASVQAYLEIQRPTTADVLALAPTGVAVNITGTLTLAAGYLLADVAAAINSKLAAYFATMKPGDTVYLHRIRTIVSETPGVVDFALTAPVANVASLVDATHIQMPVLGVTTWS